MNNRTVITVIAILVAIVAAAALVNVAYAFISETENGGNNFDGNPVEIRILDRPNGSNVKMQLPLVPTSSIEGNGPWHFSSYNRSVTGYLDTVCPNDKGYIRIWIDMKNPESWAVVQSITLNIFETDTKSQEFILFRADSELMEVGGEPIRRTIPVETWTGEDARKIVISVEYKDRITVNPWKIGEDASELLVSTIKFISATQDPIPSIPVIFHVGNEKTLEGTVEVYPGNVVNPPFLPEGYEAVDWYYKTKAGPMEKWDFETHHVSEDDLNASNELHLYTEKTLTKYSIHYNLDGGNDSGNNPIQYTVENDFYFSGKDPTHSSSGFTLVTPTAPEGYMFAGWSGTGITGTSTEVTIRDMHSDRTYTANWQYKVVFDPNYGSGSGSGEMDDQIISKSSYRSLTPNAFVNSDNNKLFLHWSTTAADDLGSHHYEDRESVLNLPTTTELYTTTITLYAIWADKCTLYYNSGDCEGTAPFEVTNIVPGTLVKVSDKGELTGEFVGWSTSILEPYSGKFYYPGDDILITSDTTLYAVVENYTITFDANGGRGSMSVQSMSTKVAMPINSNHFNKDGNLFYKWNTLANGSGTYYEDGESVRLTSNLTLYAIWGIGVTYYPDGADSGTVPKPTVIQAAGPLTLAINSGSLQKAGCTFGGWNTEDDGTGITYAAGATIDSFTTTTVLFALWNCDVIYKDGNITKHTDHTVSGREVTVWGEITSPGYVFVNWNTSADGDGESHTPGKRMIVDNTTTLYAIWRSEITVQFNANTGTGSAMDNVVLESGVRTQLPTNTYTKDEYSFYCWNTAPDGSGTSYSNSAFITFKSPTTTTVTLYAIWKHAVVFNKNGGPADVEMPATAYVSDGGTVPMPYIVMDGFSVEWYTTPECTGERFYLDGEVSGHAATPVDDNTTLYGKWSLRVYFVSNFKDPEKTDSSIRDKKQEMAYNIATQINPSNLYSDDQKSWNTRSDGRGIFYAKDATLTLKNPMALFAWYKNSVSFNANGGTGTMDPLEVDGPTPLTLNAFTWYGHTFLGWSTDPNSSVVTYADGATISASNITLYAVWSNRVTVTLDQTGATTPIDTPITWINGTTISTLASLPVKDGYTFAGFYTKANGEGLQIYNGAGEVQDQYGYVREGKADYNGGSTLTLHVYWIQNQLTVIFHGNDSTGGSMENQIITSTDPTKTLDVNAFERDGYNFTGWNTAARGTGTAYAAGADVSSLIIAPDSVLEIYAQWIGKITVTFHSNFAPDETKEQHVPESIATPLLPNTFTRTNYVFIGWATSSEGDVVYANGANITVGVDTPLYAKWTNEISVTLDQTDATTTISSPITWTLGSSVTTLALVPYRTGYDFGGFYTEANGEGFQIYDASGVAQNHEGYIETGNAVYDDSDVLTLYAKWIEHKLTVTFNANGGTGEMAVQTIMYSDLTKTLSPNVFTKEDHTFANWDTNDVGGGTPYDDEDNVASLILAPDSTLTLYAQWDESP